MRPTHVESIWALANIFFLGTSPVCDTQVKMMSTMHYHALFSWPFWLYWSENVLDGTNRVLDLFSRFFLFILFFFFRGYFSFLRVGKHVAGKIEIDSSRAPSVTLQTCNEPAANLSKSSQKLMSSHMAVNPVGAV